MLARSFLLKGAIIATRAACKTIWII